MNKLSSPQEQYDSLWKALLKIREWVKNNNEAPLLYLNLWGAEWRFEPEPSPSCFFSIGDSSREYFAIWDNTNLVFNQPPKSNIATFLQLYLPHCFARLSARHNQQTLCTAHVAQTVDGKIAAVSGDSKWIGNRENLIHAHRMRALHDAVMVGKNTFLTDHPKLTVRHVPGENPHRFVIWGSGDIEPISNFTPIICKNGQLEVTGAMELETLAGRIDCTEILKSLYQKGIDNVYLEGGGISISQFLKQGLINQLQIHISNKILGSGISAFQWEELPSIQDCLLLTQRSYYEMGDEIMIVNDQD